MKTLQEAAYLIKCYSVTLNDNVIWGMKHITCEIFDISESELEAEIKKA